MPPATMIRNEGPLRKATEAEQVALCVAFLLRHPDADNKALETHLRRRMAAMNFRVPKVYQSSNYRMARDKCGIGVSADGRGRIVWIEPNTYEALCKTEGVEPNYPAGCKKGVMPAAPPKPPKPVVRKVGVDDVGPPMPNRPPLPPPVEVDFPVTPKGPPPAVPRAPTTADLNTATAAMFDPKRWAAMAKPPPAPPPPRPSWYSNDLEAAVGLLRDAMAAAGLEELTVRPADLAFRRVESGNVPL